jgi:hypothetical protein
MFWRLLLGLQLAGFELHGHGPVAQLACFRLPCDLVGHWPWIWQFWSIQLVFFLNSQQEKGLSKKKQEKGSPFKFSFV